MRATSQNGPFATSPAKRPAGSVVKGLRGDPNAEHLGGSLLTPPPLTSLQPAPEPDTVRGRWHAPSFCFLSADPMQDRSHRVLKENVPMFGMDNFLEKLKNYRQIVNPPTL